MMSKRTGLLAIVGLFLAATLIWSVPVFAQLKSGGSPQSLNQNKRPNYSSANRGMLEDPQTSQRGQFGLGTPGSGGSLQSPNQDKRPRYGNSFGYGGTLKKTQIGWKKPGKDKNQAPSTKKTHTLEKRDHQPRSQTPGGTNIP